MDNKRLQDEAMQELKDDAIRIYKSRVKELVCKISDNNRRIAELQEENDEIKNV